MEIATAGVGDGDDDAPEACGIGGFEGAGDGFQGCAGGEDVVDDGDAFVVQGRGRVTAKAPRRFWRGRIGSGWRIAGVCFSGGLLREAFERGFFGEVGGEGLGLVVAAGDLAGPVQGDGDEDVGLAQQRLNARLLKQVAREDFGDGPAMAVFQLVNQLAKRIAVGGEGDDLLEGVLALAMTVRAGGSGADRLVQSGRMWGWRIILRVRRSRGRKSKRRSGHRAIGN